MSEVPKAVYKYFFLILFFGEIPYLRNGSQVYGFETKAISCISLFLVRPFFIMIEIIFHL